MLGGRVNRAVVVEVPGPAGGRVGRGIGERHRQRSQPAGGCPAEAGHGCRRRWWWSAQRLEHVIPRHQLVVLVQHDARVLVSPIVGYKQAAREPRAEAGRRHGDAIRAGGAIGGRSVDDAEGAEIGVAVAVVDDEVIAALARGDEPPAAAILGDGQSLDVRRQVPARTGGVHLDPGRSVRGLSAVPPDPHAFLRHIEVGPLVVGDTALGYAANIERADEACSNMACSVVAQPPLLDDPARVVVRQEAVEAAVDLTVVHAESVVHSPAEHAGGDINELSSGGHRP